MKKALIYGLLFLLGCIIAIGISFVRNSSHVEPVVITFVDDAYQQTKFSLEQAPLQSLRGTITDLSGDIWWESRVATEPSQLTEKSMQIQQGEVISASSSGTLSVSFGQAGSVSLQKQSTVEVIQTLPTNLVFTQPMGDVTYLSNSSPISVRSLNMIVHIDNGTMTVHVDANTGDITVKTVSGSATIAYNSPTFISKVWHIDQGEIFTYYSDERKGYFNASL